MHTNLFNKHYSEFEIDREKESAPVPAGLDDDGFRVVGDMGMINFCCGCDCEWDERVCENTMGEDLHTQTAHINHG